MARTTRTTQPEAQVKNTVDSKAVAAITDEPEVTAALQKLADDILTEARANVQSMGAVETGKLLNSGHVVVMGDELQVVFDTDYAAAVHEGNGRTPPRPYLAQAAMKTRDLS